MYRAHQSQSLCMRLFLSFLNLIYLPFVDSQTKSLSNAILKSSARFDELFMSELPKEK